jgi:hypothetical protein
MAEKNNVGQTFLNNLRILPNESGPKFKLITSSYDEEDNEQVIRDYYVSVCRSDTK